MRVLVGCPLPPKTSGNLLGTLVIQVCRLQVSSDSFGSYNIPICRIQFWGDDSHVDLLGADTNTSNVSSVEYPLLGTFNRLKHYFADMGGLTMLVLIAGQSNNNHVQCTLPLLPIVEDLFQSIHSSSERRSFTSSHRITLPLMSRCTEHASRSLSTSVIGEIEVETTVRIYETNNELMIRSGLNVNINVDHQIQASRNIALQLQSDLDGNAKQRCSIPLDTGKQVDTCSDITPQLLEIQRRETRVKEGRSESYEHPSPELKFSDQDRCMQDLTYYESEIDDMTLSSTTDDDSIILAAIAEGKRSLDQEWLQNCSYKTLKKVRLFEDITPTKLCRNHDDRHETEDRIITSILSPAVSDHSSIRSPYIVEENEKNSSHKQVEIFQFVELSLKKIDLSFAAAEHICNITGSYQAQVECHLSYELPPTAITSAQKNARRFSNAGFLVFQTGIRQQRGDSGQKREWDPKVHLDREISILRATNESSRSKSIAKIKGTHELSHTNTWSLRLSGENKDEEWSENSIIFNLSIRSTPIRAQRKKSFVSNEQKTNNKKSKANENVPHKKRVIVATASLNLQELLSRGSEPLETYLPLTCTNIALVNDGQSNISFGTIYARITLLTDQQATRSNCATHALHHRCQNHISSSPASNFLNPPAHSSSITNMIDPMNSGHGKLDLSLKKIDIRKVTLLVAPIIATEPPELTAVDENNRVAKKIQKWWKKEYPRLTRQRRFKVSQDNTIKNLVIIEPSIFNRNSNVDITQINEVARLLLLQGNVSIIQNRWRKYCSSLGPRCVGQHEERSKLHRSTELSWEGRICEKEYETNDDKAYLPTINDKSEICHKLSSGKKSKVSDGNGRQKCASMHKIQTRGIHKTISIDTRHIHNEPRLRTADLHHNIRIHIGEVCGLREIMTLWLDSGSYSRLEENSTICNYPLSSSGVLVTFRFRTCSDASKCEWKYFTTEIVDIGNNNRCHTFEFETTVSTIVSEEITNYMETHDLEFWLWFVPSVTRHLLERYPTSSLDNFALPHSAKKICQAQCTLKGVLNSKTVAINDCPWIISTIPNSDEVNTIGYLHVSIGICDSEQTGKSSSTSAHYTDERHNRVFHAEPIHGISHFRALFSPKDVQCQSSIWSEDSVENIVKDRAVEISSIQPFLTKNMKCISGEILNDFDEVKPINKATATATKLEINISSQMKVINSNIVTAILGNSDDLSGVRKDKCLDFIGCDRDILQTKQQLIPIPSNIEGAHTSPSFSPHKDTSYQYCKTEDANDINDSWSGRNLSSVLASLDVVTSTLKKHSNNSTKEVIGESSKPPFQLNDNGQILKSPSQLTYKNEMATIYQLLSQSKTLMADVDIKESHDIFSECSNYKGCNNVSKHHAPRNDSVCCQKNKGDQECDNHLSNKKLPKNLKSDVLSSSHETILTCEQEEYDNADEDKLLTDSYIISASNNKEKDQSLVLGQSYVKRKTCPDNSKLPHTHNTCVLHGSINVKPAFNGDTSDDEMSMQLIDNNCSFSSPDEVIEEIGGSCLKYPLIHESKTNEDSDDTSSTSFCTSVKNLKQNKQRPIVLSFDSPMSSSSSESDYIHIAKVAKEGKYHYSEGKERKDFVALHGGSSSESSSSVSIRRRPHKHYQRKKYLRSRRSNRIARIMRSNLHKNSTYNSDVSTTSDECKE